VIATLALSVLPLFASIPNVCRQTYEHSAVRPSGRLANVSDWLGHTWTFAWDGAGKPTGGTAPGGILSTNLYDAAGHLSSRSVGSLAGRAVTRDLAGLKTREDITAGPYPVPSFVRYAENTFDAADRLISASVRYGSHTNAAVSETYQYDGNGALTNLISASNCVYAELRINARTGSSSETARPARPPPNKAVPASLSTCGS
jgi:YD repeat-containing protein